MAEHELYGLHFHWLRKHKCPFKAFVLNLHMGSYRYEAGRILAEDGSLIYMAIGARVDHHGKNVLERVLASIRSLAADSQPKLTTFKVGCHPSHAATWPHSILQYGICLCPKANQGNCLHFSKYASVKISEIPGRHNGWH
jgi:hypothetical protein